MVGSLTPDHEFLYARITAPDEVAMPALGEMFPGTALLARAAVAI